MLQTFIITVLCMTMMNQLQQYYTQTENSEKNTTPLLTINKNMPSKIEFKNRLYLGHYQHCLQLIQTDQIIPTEQDLQELSVLIPQERDAKIKKEAEVLYCFIYDFLSDPDHTDRILTSLRKRTGSAQEFLAEQYRNQTTDQAKLIHAIKNHEHANLDRILNNNPNAAHLPTNYQFPIELAIAHSNSKAVEMLYRKGGFYAQQIHLEQNYNVRTLLVSNTKTPENRSNIHFLSENNHKIEECIMQTLKKQKTQL